MSLCQDGNFREGRYFTPWNKPRVHEEHVLPEQVRKITHQNRVPFGDAVVETLDTVIGAESCEEL